MKHDQRINSNLAPIGGSAFAGRKAIVIGGTGGLGRALSQVIAAHGGKVIVVGQTFRDRGVAGIEFVPGDLTLLRKARLVADLLPAETADFLIFTTGIFAASKREETSEGIERDMAVSFLSRLVMLRAMAARLGTARENAQGKPRVFIMGYPGTGRAGNPADLNSESGYKLMVAHVNTVAGNEALVLDSAKRYPQFGTFGLNPGVIKTAIRGNMLGEGSLKHVLIEGLIGLFAASPQTYAARVAPLLLNPEIERFSGALFNHKAEAIQPSPAFTPTYVAEYITASEALAGRAGDVIGGDASDNQQGGV
ncbi:MAG: dehydrogenase protein [Bradyrhizobium sp.]|nr:dehydrogenase protein [Bradyrhizobium sp.]